MSPEMTLLGPSLPLTAPPLDLSQHHLRLHLSSQGVASLLLLLESGSRHPPLSGPHCPSLRNQVSVLNSICLGIRSCFCFSQLNPVGTEQESLGRVKSEVPMGHLGGEVERAVTSVGLKLKIYIFPGGTSLGLFGSLISLKPWEG